MFGSDLGKAVRARQRRQASDFDRFAVGSTCLAQANSPGQQPNKALLPKVNIKKTRRECNRVAHDVWFLSFVVVGDVQDDPWADKVRIGGHFQHVVDE